MALKFSSQDCLCCVSQVPLGHVFIFINFQEPNFLFYFNNEPLIIEHCVVQLPIVCIFSAVFVVVVVELLF
jgi:hypothetical protein